MKLRQKETFNPTNLYAQHFGTRRGTNKSDHL